MEMLTLILWNKVSVIPIKLQFLNIRFMKT